MASTALQLLGVLQDARAVRIWGLAIQTSIAAGNNLAIKANGIPAAMEV